MLEDMVLLRMQIPWWNIRLGRGREAAYSNFSWLNIALLACGQVTEIRRPYSSPPNLPLHRRMQTSG